MLVTIPSTFDMKWICISSTGDVEIGFGTLAGAEKFIRGQSSNPLWVAQWNFQIKVFSGEQVAVASASGPVNLNFKQ